MNDLAMPASALLMASSLCQGSHGVAMPVQYRWRCLCVGPLRAALHYMPTTNTGTNTGTNRVRRPRAGAIARLGMDKCRVHVHVCVCVCVCVCVYGAHGH